MSSADALPPCRETYEQAKRERFPYAEGADYAAVGIGYLVSHILARTPCLPAPEESHLYRELRQSLVGVLTRRAAAVPCTLEIARWLPAEPTDQLAVERAEPLVRFLAERARQSHGREQGWCVNKHCWCHHASLLDWSKLPPEHAEDPRLVWQHRSELTRSLAEPEDAEARCRLVRDAESRRADVRARRRIVHEEEKASGGGETLDPRYHALNAEDDVIIADFVREVVPKLHQAAEMHCVRCDEDPVWRTERALSGLDAAWGPAYDAALLLKRAVELVTDGGADTFDAAPGALIVDAPALLGQPTPPYEALGPIASEERVSPGKLRSLPEGGVARYHFPVGGRYGVRVFAEGNLVRGLWIEDGLRDDGYDLADWQVVLRRVGLVDAPSPDTEAPAGLHWSDLRGAEVHVYADGLPERGGKVWSVQIYEVTAHQGEPLDVAALHERITCILALQRVLADPPHGSHADAGEDALQAALDASAILDALSDQRRSELSEALVTVTASGGDPALPLIGLLPPDRRDAYRQSLTLPPWAAVLTDVMKDDPIGGPSGVSDTGVMPAERQELEALLEQLALIPPGAEAASSYHGLMVRVLDALFSPYLVEPRKEEKLNEGRKRVDIVFTNNAETGFFFRLNLYYRVVCPQVFIECKNYTGDPANPELDQLAGRLSPKRGMFGILVCRSMGDRGHLIRGCRDRVNEDKGHILVLDDEDIRSLVDMRLRDAQKEIDSYLDRAFRQLVM